MQLTFDAELKGLAAQRQIWINYVKAKFAENKEMVGTGTQEFETLSGLTDDQIAALKVYGLKEGVIQKIEGVTTKYANVAKAYELTLWFFLEPEPSLMSGVTDYTEKPRDPDWFSPV